MNYQQIPQEISITGIYFPPILIATLLGILIAWLITRALNFFGFARYVWHPPLFI